MVKDRLQQANASWRLQNMSEIAEQWLDMGERERARPLFDQGKTLNDVLPPKFLGQLGRLEPTEVISRLPKLSVPGIGANYRNRALVELAVELATDHRLAEQIFNLQAILAIRTTLSSWAAILSPASPGRSGTCEEGRRIGYGYWISCLCVGIGGRRPGR